MSEHGLRNYHQAKLKAAERLGIFDDASLPRNAEIEDARREYLRLFQADTQPVLLRQRREVAIEAMRFFATFEPRLVGAVLDGSADIHSAICLHLYSDNPNALACQLRDHGIPYDESSRRLRFGPDATKEFPVFLFSADDAAIDLTVLPFALQRQAPFDRIDDRPMKRASLGAVEALLAESCKG